MITPNYDGHGEPGDSCLTLEKLMEAKRKIDALPKCIIGIVCRPGVTSRVRQMAIEEAHPLFGPVPVYEKKGQLAEAVTFYDQALLNEYLKSP